MKSTWKDKRESIQSKFETCTLECVTAYRSDRKCRDSIEAVIADIWNLRDWLLNDPSIGISGKDIYAFIDNKADHIRACGDLAVKDKYYKVDDQRHENTELTWEGNHRHPSGYPVVFSIIRRYKDNPGNIDKWEDAYELAKRAIKQWRSFLNKYHLM